MADSKENYKSIVLDFPNQIRPTVESSNASQDFLDTSEEYLHMWDDYEEGYLSDIQHSQEQSTDLYDDLNEECFGYLEIDNPNEDDKSSRLRLRNMKLRDILAITLPTPLEKRSISQYAVAILIAFICVLLSIYYKELFFLTGTIISGFLTYQALTTSIDFANGQICEIPVVCTHAIESKIRNKTQVTFRTGDEEPIYYQFDIPGNKANEFQPNMVYIIYFNINNPRLLITYTSA